MDTIKINPIYKNNEYISHCASVAVNKIIVEKMNPESAVSLMKACALFEAANIHFLDYVNGLESIKVTESDVLKNIPFEIGGSKKEMAIAVARKTVLQVNANTKRLSDVVSNFVDSIYSVKGPNRDVLDKMTDEILKLPIVKHGSDASV
jgi:hypothetical protein